MESFETLKLNHESSLIPIDEVPTHLRDRFDSSKTTFILSRSTARRGALALDKHGAALVQLFITGETLPRALKKLSSECDISIEQLVAMAYPLLELLVQEEHLVPVSHDESVEQEGTHKPLSAGDIFEAYTIVSRIQQLDDSVVYKALAADGTSVALKVLSRHNSLTHDFFRREALILEHLGGAIAPRLVEACLDGAKVFIAMEWIEGYSLIDWAARIRNLPHEKCYAELISLSRSLIATYVSLHRSGVFHGDIWTRNILIESDGTIRLLDFGLASFSPANELVGLPPRATNAYFRAPDLAAAQLAGVEAPPPSIGSEVYGLGVMLYFTLTGRNYINFSYELEEQLKQVCESPMLPFTAHGAKAWPEMEELLAMMLHKIEEQRISSLEETISRLATISAPRMIEESDGTRDPIPFIRSYRGERFAQPIEAPSASVFFGIGGLAYAMLNSSICLEEPELFPEADYLTASSKLWITSDPSGSCNPEADIPDHVLGSNSIFHRVEGSSLMEALVAHTMGDGQTLRNSCLRYVSGIHQNNAEAEFAFGNAGLLNAFLQLSFLVKENEVIISQGNELAQDILSEIQSYSSIAESPIRFIGFAHGWCGILYSLLSWGGHYNTDVVKAVLPFLHALNEHKVSCQMGSLWRAHFDHPVESGDTPSWCSGSGGFVLLWTEAFAATNDEFWLTLAREAGRHTALHQDLAFDLCCGLAGRAFCLGTLYRFTGEMEWLEQARNCASRAKPIPGGYLHSLFKGIPGIELARVELNRPHAITFPFLASDRYGERMSVGPLR
jgi:serine/threonine-protein kinase